ncbi:hypothetical protein [Streptomyces sp. NBC_00696]|uniref:hypothetical protein n=1 Tax=Streptomyces sp. NBC_00696 TaxID=2903672 RepID=UPI002E35737D|nr:hypothetical protein [Streptomyces sp. NBC_00696]
MSNSSAPQLPDFSEYGVTHSVLHRIGIKFGSMEGRSVEISATGEVLDESQLSLVQRKAISPYRRPYGDDGFSYFDGEEYPDGVERDFEHFMEVCARVALADGTALRSILRGKAVRVPVFGSPPNSWRTLQSVMANAAGIASAVGLANNIPTLLLAYSGGVILVHFVNPIVASAGQAVAEGIGAKIRRSFRIEEQITLEVADRAGNELSEGSDAPQIAPGEDAQG